MTLKKLRMTPSKMVTELQVEGIETTVMTVRKWFYRWNLQLGLQDLHRHGRPSRITAEMELFIEA